MSVHRDEQGNVTCKVDMTLVAAPESYVRERIEGAVRAVVKERVYRQCESTAASTRKQCRHPALIGSILCYQHRADRDAPNRASRHIVASDAPAIVAELVEALMGRLT